MIASNIEVRKHREKEVIKKLEEEISYSESTLNLLSVQNYESMMEEFSEKENHSVLKIKAPKIT